MSITKHFSNFKETYPGIAKAYEDLGKEIHKSGPLDDRTRALIKLAVSAGAGLEGAVHSQTRKALELGITAEEIRHTVILSFPTIGFPSMMAALSWVNDILGQQNTDAK
jgi:alkylhydroperoxidase/carboxymuconolactone decarboxylase family protein YurZ